MIAPSKSNDSSMERNTCNSVIFPHENDTVSITSKPEFIMWDTIIHNMCLNDSKNSLWVWKTSVSNLVFICILSVILNGNLIHSVRFCVPNMIDKCTNEKMNSSAEQCFGYTSYVYSKDKFDQKQPAWLATIS